MGADLVKRLPEPGAAVEQAGDRPPSTAETMRVLIERQVEAFGAVMPAGVDHERFGRLVLTAVKSTPQLMECFGTQQGQTTVLLAAMQCAALGLEPNTATQDAWLLPRKNKGVMECELSIGYRGLLKLARRTGQVKSVRAAVVREKDEFRWAYGLEADVLEHTPFDGTDKERGPLTHAYAIVRFLNGGVQFVVLNRAAVEKRRAMSASWKNTSSRPYSPWTTWEDEMWCKSALRALVPHLELSTEDMRGLELEEQPLAINQEGVIDIKPPGELAAGPAVEVEEEVPGATPATDPSGASTTPDADTPPPPPPAVEAVVVEPDDPMSDGQNRALHALLKRKRGATGDGRFPVLTELLGREVTTSKEVSFGEAAALIDRLNEMPDHRAQA
jgi:recombination protein RecT